MRFVMNNRVLQQSIKAIKSNPVRTVLTTLGIMIGIATVITVLSAGVIKVVDENKKEHFFEINSGFLEVKPSNEVRCIVEQ